MSQYTTRDVPTTKSPNASHIGLSTDKQHLTQYRMGTRQRTASIPSGILFHPIVWPQYTNVADRQTGQDNGPVAQGEPLLITVTQKAAVDVGMFSSCHGGATGMASMLRTKFHLDPSNCSATIHQRYRRTDRQTTGQKDRQRPDSIGRTVLQTVAQKQRDL